MKIYHNPRCSKSRETLQILTSSGVQPEIIEYLQTPPTVEELKKIINLLGIKPQELLRKGEAEFRENFKGKSYSDDEWIQIMVDHPKLIERPIIVQGDKAVLGRPPENVKKLLK